MPIFSTSLRAPRRAALWRIGSPRAPAGVMWGTVALGIALGCLACGSARAGGWPSLAALQRTGALVTASAVDLGDGTVLAQLNADERLTPASLTKLTTAAAALATWPADKAFHTRVFAAQPARDGRVDGDLILQGAGDPSLDDDSLWQLAAQLRGAGITSVNGRLIVDPQPFGRITCATTDRCKALRRSDKAYNAEVAAMGVDFGTWCVIVRPTRPGAAASIRGCGVAHLPIQIEGHIGTVRAGKKQTFWVERYTHSGIDSLHVGGQIPVGDRQQVYRSMSNPALGAGRLLKESLREIGVSVAGPVVVSAAAVPANMQVLAQTQGLLLREQLGRMLRYSNNYIADVLAMDIAASHLDAPPAKLADAGAVLSDFLERVQGPLRHTALTPPPLYSGSGLTWKNRLSATDLVTLLAHEYHDTRNFPAFYGGLVVPRQAPFAFLRRGNRAWLDRVALKTGTMNDRYSICGLAGYLRKRDGGWIAFATLVNGGPHHKHIPLYKALGAERADIERLLQQY